MKKYIGIIAAAFLAYACADHDYETAFQDYVGINTAGLKDFPENAGSIKIPVIFGGEPTNSSAFNVTYEVTGGTYGVDYTVDGGNGASGTVSFPAGALKDNAIQYITVRGVPDFDVEDDVPLTITLKSSDRQMRVGYPYKDTFSFVITDDDCPFDFEGELVGLELNFDLVDYTQAADVIVTKTSETEYTIEHLGWTMIQDFWGETITDSAPTVVKIAPGGAITIEEQFVFSTLFNGAPSEYNIVGTGQVNYCDGTITLNYDIVYSDHSGGLPDNGGSIAAYAFASGYSSTELLVATLAPPDEE